MYKTSIMKLRSHWRTKSPEPKSSKQFCSQRSYCNMFYDRLTDMKFNNTSLIGFLFRFYSDVFPVSNLSL